MTKMAYLLIKYNFLKKKVGKMENQKYILFHAPLEK